VSCFLLKDVMAKASLDFYFEERCGCKYQLSGTYVMDFEQVVF